MIVILSASGGAWKAGHRRGWSISSRRTCSRGTYRPPARLATCSMPEGDPGALAARGYRVTLLDLSPALLDLARARIAAAEPAVRQRVAGVVEGSITDLTTFANAQFDAVLCLGGVLSHLPDLAARQRALRELGRVLRPAGPLFATAFNRLAGFRSAVQWPGAWSQFFPRLLEGGQVPMGPDAIPTYAYFPEEFTGELTRVGFDIRALYGCQGLGAHLQEEHLLALMDDRERWVVWRQVLLDTCGHPNVIGVSSQLLAVASQHQAE